MLMRQPLGEITYACVKHDKGRVDEINDNVSSIFKYYEIFTHWAVPEVGSIFTRPKFTAAELQDHKLVLSRSIEARDMEYKKSMRHKKRMELLDQEMNRMSPEQKAAYNNEVARVMDELSDKIKNL